MLPNLSAEQRAAALAKAAEARKLRADFTGQLRRGDITVSEALEWADDLPAAGKIRVKALLQALPGIGKVKAERLMEDLGIAPTRRIAGLGPNQRRDLLGHFGGGQ